MAQLVIEGDTLGQKHRAYNKLVNEAIKNNPQQRIAAIDYEAPDLDNLFKIDIACNNRNVEYVLEVLKCEDLLYVSRVIKKSTWLITNEQYCYIINPKFLHNNLYPEMTVKGFNKLILHIRLNLKDEKRVEEFFDFYKQKDLQKALKWLPHCSNTFVENVIKNHVIPAQILKRLCERSITFLEVFCRHSKLCNRNMIQSTMFVLNNNVEKFLDNVNAAYIPNLGPKYTKKIMKKCPDKIMNNLQQYLHCLDLYIFSKYLKEENIKEFILNIIKNEKIRVQFDFNRNIKFFINRLPQEERFEFVKKVFIDRTCKIEHIDDKTLDVLIMQCSGNLRFQKKPSTANIYSWYKYAPFSIAFADLKMLIRKESNPSERMNILLVMLHCTRRDMKSIKALIKYYREHNINEPFKFKNKFVDHLIKKTDPHRYDKETWEYLNDLFGSMDVYSKSEKNVQTCVESIILYNVVHGQNIPEIIETKFVYNNLVTKYKLNEMEREKIINYLYKLLTSKLPPIIKSETEFNETIEIVENLLNLLNYWNKELQDYPSIIEKIRELVVIKSEKKMETDLLGIYNIKKSWRKLLFAESIILCPKQDCCLNALKHGPDLLTTFREYVDRLCLNDHIFYARFFKTIRIYWPRCLTQHFKTMFIENLATHSNNSSLIKGLFVLLSNQELTNFVKQYAPTAAKIDWKQDNVELRLRKSIAACIHFARPQPPVSLALLYAEGDYLQYVLPSLTAILCNKSPMYIGKHITQLLDAPVSLQKHGIRIAFFKLKHKELIEMFAKIWCQTENNSIRSNVFQQVYMMLSREHDERVIFEIWNLLSKFIEELSFDENKKIYVLLSNITEIPLAVRPAFWTKSYEFLKKLPPTADNRNFIHKLMRDMDDIMEFLNDEIVSNILLENFHKNFVTQTYRYSYQAALFLFSIKNEIAQRKRYEIFLMPLVDKAIAVLDNQDESVNYVRHNLRAIFDYMSENFEKFILNKGNAIPIDMYNSLLDKFQNILSSKANYVLLTNLKLSLGYIKILNDVKTNKEIVKSYNEKVADESPNWEHLYANVTPLFGKLCLQHLKDDVKKYFPSIFIIFADVLEHKIRQYTDHNIINILRVLKAFAQCNNFIQGPLLALNVMTAYSYYDDDEKWYEMKLEILNKIKHHPSDEVKVHYEYYHTRNFISS